MLEEARLPPRGAEAQDTFVEIPETLYARTADGLDIAYQVLGEGPRDLVWCVGLTSNIEALWNMPEIASTYRRLARFCRLILFDRRGSGVSDRVPGIEAPPLEVGVEDIRAVMDASGSAHATLFGMIDGAPLAVLFAAAEPGRVEGLILWNPDEVRGLRSDEYPTGWSWAEWEEFIRWHERSWGTPGFTKEFIRLFLPSLFEDPSAVERWGRYLRQCGTPKSMAALWRMLRDTDVIPVLDSVQARTLVLHRSQEDEQYELRSSEFVAAKIPDSRLVMLPGVDPTPFLDPEPVIEEIAEFLTGARPQRDTDRVLATVLFTDIVGSTERLAELGDRRWKELLASHAEIAKEQIDRHRGRYLQTTGDGLLATFDGPARAVRCAQEIGDAVGQLGVQIRAGCHTGEVELDGDDIRGVAVHIGARVAALAEPSEVLVSSTVKDLVAGSGLRFEDAGEHELKGVPDRWHLYRVVGERG